MAGVWRADGTGEPVLFKGHTSYVRYALLAADGRYVVTAADEDDTARVWRVDGTGEPVVLEGHTRTYTHATFSDGQTVLTASKDDTARVWRADGVVTSQSC